MQRVLGMTLIDALAERDGVVTVVCRVHGIELAAEQIAMEKATTVLLWQ